MDGFQNINQIAFHYYPPLHRVKRYVDLHYSEPISLKTAAGAAGLESKYFSAFFHRKTGVCFSDWLASVRIARAVELIKAQERTITSTALAVGFRDLRTFERTFRRCLGMTPRAFKKSIRPR